MELQFWPMGFDGENVGDNIIVDWSTNYDFLGEHVSTKYCPSLKKSGDRIWEKVRGPGRDLWTIRSKGGNRDSLDRPERKRFSSLHYCISWREIMGVKIFDTVVLERDLTAHGLKKGDIGAVVELYEPDGIEVEFVMGSGKTQALVTLRLQDVRSIKDSEILAVRSLDAA